MRMNRWDWLARFFKPTPPRRCKDKPAKGPGRKLRTFTFIVPTSVGTLKIVKTAMTQSEAKAQAKAHLVESKLLKRRQRLPLGTKVAKVVKC